MTKSEQGQWMGMNEIDKFGMRHMLYWDISLLAVSADETVWNTYVTVLVGPNTYTSVLGGPKRILVYMSW